MNNDRFKFRVWSKEYGYETQHSLDIEDVKESNDNNGIPLRNKRESFVFEQCTGLKDKNSVLIYEGDICKLVEGYKENIGNILVADWENGGFFFAPTGSRTQRYNLVSFNEQAEIIGNVHENPELLEAK